MGGNISGDSSLTQYDQVKIKLKIFRSKIIIRI